MVAHDTVAKIIQAVRRGENVRNGLTFRNCNYTAFIP
jgi:hypothetical protein